jgi:hypothetical protein
MSLLVSSSAAAKIESACGVDTLTEVALQISRARRGLDQIADFRSAIAGARRTLAGNKAVRAVYVLTMRGDDSIWFVRVGARGGWKKIADLSGKESA